MNAKLILAALVVSMSLAACAKKEEPAEAPPAEAPPAEAPAAEAPPAEAPPAETPPPADGAAPAEPAPTP